MREIAARNEADMALYPPPYFPDGMFDTFPSPREQYEQAMEGDYREEVGGNDHKLVIPRPPSKERVGALTSSQLLVLHDEAEVLGLASLIFSPITTLLSSTEPEPTRAILYNNPAWVVIDFAHGLGVRPSMLLTSRYSDPLMGYEVLSIIQYGQNFLHDQLTRGALPTIRANAIRCRKSFDFNPSSYYYPTFAASGVGLVSQDSNFVGESSPSIRVIK